MMLKKQNIKIAHTASFSSLVNDYVNRDEKLKEFIFDFPSEISIQKAMEEKQFSLEKRNVLVDVLKSQYAHLKVSELVQQNIESLLQENTFSICTAHQPSIFTGYLYFIYKIIQAIKLSNECKALFPANNFVPIFFIGSEDNDLEEIGEFNLLGKKYQWQTNQQGSCGEMDTADLVPIIDEIKKYFNTGIEDEKELLAIFQNAYKANQNLADATRYIVNELMGRFGIVCIDGNEARLKSLYKDVLKDELLHQHSFKIVSNTIDKLSINYHGQAKPRELNLFHKKYNSYRERIELNEGVYQVVNSDLNFTAQEMLAELENHPEHFSPNVILRPMYQETILPNIAFVGGGGELAYWMQLKDLFTNYHVQFPILFLRNSLLFIDEKSSTQIDKLGLTLEQLFMPTNELNNLLLAKNNVIHQLKEYEKNIELQLNEMVQLAATVSVPLEESVKAHRQKNLNIVNRIHEKFAAHIKRKEVDTYSKIAFIKENLFPNNSLQERHDNVISLYKMYGKNLFDILLENEEGFGEEFIVLE
jgi:bacillithiol biosynthesis cysteine-adding enzyme BshC